MLLASIRLDQSPRPPLGRELGRGGGTDSFAVFSTLSPSPSPANGRGEQACMTLNEQHYARRWALRFWCRQ